MNQDQIKDMLLSIENTELDFSVTLSGKKSGKVNGLYKPESREIILHNKNFETDNQLVYTALHEYTHHLLNERLLAATNGLGKMSSRCHTNEFWTEFHRLLETAEQKGVYVISLEASPELAQLTEEIRTKYLETNGRLMTEFGRALIKAFDLCRSANIRYEDYIDRVLCLPRAAAKTITKLGSLKINPAVGYENMKMIASISKPEERRAAENQILSGKSPDSVRTLMKKKVAETDEKTKLEKEKQRIEKTIAQLSQRLEFVEETLRNL
ncbi:MAG: hypothetical protein NC041_05950 [Bacteroides sp.]|nr:hypothetical protein [Prevotella sp.]MCM1407499.1 hypothetical protein [Treponema brennaborense]MCM1469989.1 hypothetical protein [Bacteroides sp.]